MAQSQEKTVDEWKMLFVEVGIPDAESQTYAEKFSDNGLSEDDLSEIDKDMLTEMNITKLDHQLEIMRISKKPNKSKHAAKAKSPTILSEMTHPQFRKFLIDWDVFKRIAERDRTSHHPSSEPISIPTEIWKYHARRFRGSERLSHQATVSCS